MRIDPERRHRRSISLRKRSYAAPGAYAVTFCTHGRECWLAEIDGGVAVPTDLGCIVKDHLRSVSQWFPWARGDAFVIMPNHVHAIVVIRSNAATRRPDPEADEWHGTEPGSVAAIVHNVKAVCARRINAGRGTPGAPAWQRNYYERVLRENEIDRACAYIAANPANWHKDSHNPLFNVPKTTE